MRKAKLLTGNAGLKPGTVVDIVGNIPGSSDERGFVFNHPDRDLDIAPWVWVFETENEARGCFTGVWVDDEEEAESEDEAPKHTYEERVVYVPERPYVVQVGVEETYVGEPVWEDIGYYKTRQEAEVEADTLGTSNRHVRVVKRGTIG